jgi:sialic acid synthase SpsE
LIYIIAEIGFNHEGNMSVAGDMIKAAAQAGAHAVKFQTFRASDIALPSNLHYESIKCGEIDLNQHKELFSIARECNLDFISTPFSPWAVELLEKVGVPAYKVASMDCTNKHLLEYIVQTGKPIYLSTGMASLNEISDTLDFLKKEKSGPVTLMHCLSLYPANSKDLNLEIIPFLKQVFNIPVGYSDHYPGTKACLAAAMMGAEVLETHFTLDSSKEGGDHVHSVDPEDLKKLISDITLLDIMRGNRYAVFNRPDRSFAKEYRRGLYSARPLGKGNIIKQEDLLLCRPTSEFSPNDLEWITGKVLGQDIPLHHAINKGCLKE